MTLSPFHVLSNIFIGGILCYLDFIVLVSKWPLKKHCGVDTTHVYYVFLFLLLIILLWYTSHNMQGEKKTKVIHLFKVGLWIWENIQWIHEWRTHNEWVIYVKKCIITLFLQFQTIQNAKHSSMIFPSGSASHHLWYFSSYYLSSAVITVDK